MRARDVPATGPIEGVVFFAQDIHANAEAQENLAAAFQRLLEAGVVDGIGLEGTFGPMEVLK